jgi:uncharacterized protein YjiS (DUF1127 family)
VPETEDFTMILAKLIRMLRAWRRYHHNVQELSRLGDHELADIGITRAEIPFVARAAARR